MSRAVVSMEQHRDLYLVRRDGVRRTDVANYAEARWALIAVLNWAAHEIHDRPFNLEAVRQSIIGILNWLEPDADIDKTLDRAQANFGRLAHAYTDYNWLFDDSGELRLSDISPRLFELLIETRVLADRVSRATPR